MPNILGVLLQIRTGFGQLRCRVKRCQATVSNNVPQNVIPQFRRLLRLHLVRRHWDGEGELHLRAESQLPTRATKNQQRAVHRRESQQRRVTFAFKQNHLPCTCITFTYSVYFIDVSTLLLDFEVFSIQGVGGTAKVDEGVCSMDTFTVTVGKRINKIASPVPANGSKIFFLFRLRRL